MHIETEPLVVAITSLNQEESIFKDYIFPIASALFSSLFGAGIAYFVVRHQDALKFEKDKMDTTNKWTLLADGALSNLIAIKNNYHGIITSDPIQRCIAIPTILLRSEVIKEDLSQLAFLPTNANRESPEKWSQIPRVRMMVENYNHVLHIWEKRNEIERPLKERLLRESSQAAFAAVTFEDLIKCLDKPSLASLIDLTEYAIQLTDDLIVELNDFLLNFPGYAKKRIALKKLKSYGSVLIYSNKGNPSLLAMLERSPKADYNSIQELFGRSIEELEKRYSTIYG